MPQNQLVQARIDGEIKAQATVALADMGLTVSDAVRILLTRVAKEKGMPLELMTPNAVTLAAMKEAGEGGLPRACISPFHQAYILAFLWFGYPAPWILIFRAFEGQRLQFLPIS